MSSRAPVPLPRVGDVIAAKYAVVRVLGEGGMGVVYEATHVRLGHRVAIKMLLPAMLRHEVLVSRFEREARAAARLASKHVARVTDVDVTSDGLPYMVMEFLEGRDLQQEIDERGRLSYEEAVDYVLQACSAMAEAHAIGIVHRDLKPSNLFLARDGDRGGRMVKVLDFGISKVDSERDAKLTDADVVMGTAMYMAPEQVRATHAVDARADVWALGVILYEAIAGRAPWVGTATHIAAAIVSEDAPDIRAHCDVPAELAAVIHRILQRNPDHRFADVRALAAALAPFAPAGAESGGRLDSAPTVVGAPPPVARSSAVSEAQVRDRTAPGWTQRDGAPRKGRGLVLAGAVGAVAGVLAIAGAVLALRRDEPPPPPVAAPPSVATEPLPPALDPDPAPPPTAQASAATAASAPARRPATTSRPKTSAPPASAPKPKASNGPSDKPLFL